jgi:hypothetical protein
MLRNRFLILSGGCFLAASAAWADNVGFIDCRDHPDPTQVFAKARQSHEVVASVACGERFTVLQYGFIFSRIQTKDGQVGYVYSSVIAADRSGAAVPASAPASARVPAATSNVPAATATVAQPNSPAPAQAQAAPAQPAATPQAPAATSNPPSAPVADVPASPATTTQTQPAPIEPLAKVASVPETHATPIQPTPAAPAQPQAAPASVAATEAAAPAAASVPEVTASVAQPDATPATRPDATPSAQPEPAEAAAPAIRPVSARESWEKPNAGVRTIGPRTLPLIELFGGYGFARLDGGGGVWSNMNGIVGSFGWNVKPWLQIVADSSYDFMTVSGTKTVLYGNHYGPRVFGRMRNRWGITPFVEGLIGGSRSDVTVSGTGGYSTSINTISYKVGGGLDIKPSRRFEIRLLDVDYYRTAFGTNLHQNNYWASAGIVIRLFGGSE